MADKDKKGFQGSGVSFVGGQGDSLESAIIIKGAPNTRTGIAAETLYLEKKYGQRDIRWKKFDQALLHKDGRHFDSIDVILIKEKRTMTIYFDITDFYGKPY
jgi:hypothetical protein